LLIFFVLVFVLVHKNNTGDCSGELEAVNSCQHHFGYSPLFLAARAGHASCVELLLQHGADANRTLPDESSVPFHFAVCGNSIP